MSEELKPIIVPREKLSQDTLVAVIEEYILREGTDYGHVMPELEDKVRRVMKQLESGHAKIVYDPNTETCSILKEVELKRKGVIDGI